ncbi:hypothetical protein [Flavobacterium tructae]|nr:hypothetical protein [Flavobacterium tructae]
MTGIEFYTFLQSIYTQDGQPLYKNYSFKKWLHKKDSQSFQFNGNKAVKSIPKYWLIDSKNAKNRGEKIDRNWFNNFYKQQNFNDCRASIAIWLIEKY